jgi:hypothetical protein
MILASLRAPVAHQIGPLTVKHICDFSFSDFGSRVRIEVDAEKLNLSGANFLQGGLISVSRARVTLNQVSSGRHLRVTGNVTAEKEPEIVALQDTDAGLLSFAHTSMERCIFHSAHNLRRIEIEPTVKFALSPYSFAGRRRCIADEFAWRATSRKYRRKGWALPNTELIEEADLGDGSRDLVVLPKLHPAQIAAVYRDLRSSLEARSNQPGAADFYYGEMDMRRHSVESGLAERLIIWLYWILSGYGLRASRSFFWLATFLVVGASVSAWYGFTSGPVAWTSGLIFALRAALPGWVGDHDLTTTGEVTEILLKVLGPTLFGLALLALRGRVKR